MTRELYKFIIIFLLPVSLVAQQKNVKFTLANLKNDQKAYKLAITKLGEGNQHIQNAEYGAALAAYLVADSINPYNADLNTKIGVCYLNTINKARCLYYFRLAYQLNKAISPRISFFLGRGYQLNYQWDSAKTEYQEALKSGSSKDKDEATKCMAECDNGADLMAHPVKATIQRLDNNINGPYSDFRPLLTPDGSMMVFTSTRPSSLSNEINPLSGEYEDDIFISHNHNGVWDTAKAIDPPVNTIDNDDDAYLTPDGKTLYLLRENNNGDFYVSNYTDAAGWSLPVAFSDSINSSDIESSMCLSPDGKTVYFSSDRPGGMGGLDLYYSTMQDNGTWGHPVNMGSTINTKYDEDGPYMNPDGKTLYFSSKGHNTMGGYDIFVTTNNGDSWSEPKNLGYPINTPDDDIYFSTSDDGYYGYYGRHTDTNVHIFRISMDAYMPKELVYKGTITDSISHEKLKATMQFFDKLSSPSKTDSLNGEYTVKMLAGHQYTLHIQVDGYNDYSVDYNIPDTASYRRVEQNIMLTKSKAKAVPARIDSCLQSMTEIMERFKGGVKDTNIMKNAINHFDATLCLKGFYFTVQLVAIKGDLKGFDYHKFVKTANVEKSSDGVTRVTSGQFYKYQEAKKLVKKLKRKGIKDAWIVGMYNGKRYILKNLLHPQD